MTGRQLVNKVLNHEPVERLPRDLWMVPYIHMFRKDELDSFYEMFPPDITGASKICFGKSHYSAGTPCRVGEWVDDFGAGWVALEDGIAGEVKNPPIKSKADLDNYKLPWEILDGYSSEGQAEHYKQLEKFQITGTRTRPFERLQFMRGSEQLFIDIATEDPIFLRLNEMLHEFSVREMKLVSAEAVDAVQFMDDWGSQQSLLISPAAWRKHFKPLYKEYCDIIKAAGKRVFFHTDGHIEAIYSDLIELGVDAVNSQLFCMDMELLGKKYAGKITFWGELDRQHILPFGTEDEVRESVRRMGRALMPNGKRTGIIAELSWETVTPLKNVVAAYDEFNKL
ncbi:MAG: hypothetical protein FWE82_04350 [Defluviitaleaceae bacterium]|nr:hypothetical protein [Defluviitaleaceae bacterium]